MGANWISLTPFGRVWDLAPSGVSLTFEAEYEQNRAAVKSAIRQAHAEGLQVLVIPQLWVETGGWRGEIELTDDAAWRQWSAGYTRFLLQWAKLAAEAGAEMFSVGVELRSWVTTARAPSFVKLIREIRSVYAGLLTYAANWDDVEDTVVLGELDVIGINAFFPLTHQPGADLDALCKGSAGALRGVERVARMWDKPVLFTEFGYTTRTDTALRPWEWPEHVHQVVVNEVAQAEAYHALLASFLDQPWFVGFFVWRMYANPDDVSQEPEWGFSPRGKLAELVLRDAFAAHLGADGPRPLGAALHRHAALIPGVY